MPTIRTSETRRLAAALLFSSVLLTGVARAATFDFKPRAITLDRAGAIAEVQFSSLEARPVTFDVTAFRWTQTDSGDVFTPADELLIVPPIFQIAPFESVPLRSAFRAPLPIPQTEQAYQLRFTEVVTTAKARILTLPLFRSPAEKSGTVAYALKRLSPKLAELSVKNASNMHVYIGKLTIPSGDQKAYDASLGQYVLAGRMRTFRLALTRPLQGTSAELKIEDERQSQQTVTAAVSN